MSLVPLLKLKVGDTFIADDLLVSLLVEGRQRSKIVATYRRYYIGHHYDVKKAIEIVKRNNKSFVIKLYFLNWENGKNIGGEYKKVRLEFSRNPGLVVN